MKCLFSRENVDDNATLISSSAFIWTLFRNNHKAIIINPLSCNFLPLKRIFAPGWNHCIICFDRFSAELLFLDFLSDDFYQHKRGGGGIFALSLTSNAWKYVWNSLFFLAFQTQIKTCHPFSIFFYLYLAERKKVKAWLIDLTFLLDWGKESVVVFNTFKTQFLFYSSSQSSIRLFRIMRRHTHYLHPPNTFNIHELCFSNEVP